MRRELKLGQYTYFYDTEGTPIDDRASRYDTILLEMKDDELTAEGLENMRKRGLSPMDKLKIPKQDLQKFVEWINDDS